VSSQAGCDDSENGEDILILGKAMDELGAVTNPKIPALATK
jgi:hypothetical protein